MSKVVLNASMSPDGFMTGPDVGPEHPMGVGGERLHEWLFDESVEGRPDAEVARELSATVGAVEIGRRTFDVGLEPWGDVPYPVPCFVLTYESREELPMASGTFTFVDGSIPSALELAQAAAANRDVLLMVRERRSAVPERRPGRRDRDPARAGAARRGDAAVRSPRS